MPDEQNDLPVSEAQARARAIVLEALREYAGKRIASYETLELNRLLSKDVLMLAMRGAKSAADFVDLALAAFESSSEETHMGGVVQRVAIDLATNAIDLSDVVIERDGDLWVIEVKAQTNTVTGTFRNDLLRKLKQRVDEISRHRPTRRRRVRAMLAVIRSKPVDKEETAVFPPGDRYADLNGFKYTQKYGRPFWQWLTGEPGLASLVDAIPPEADHVAAAREACRVRLQSEMRATLEERGDPLSIIAVMRLADELNS